MYSSSAFMAKKKIYRPTEHVPKRLRSLERNASLYFFPSHMHLIPPSPLVFFRRPENCLVFIHRNLPSSATRRPSYSALALYYIAMDSRNR